MVSVAGPGVSDLAVGDAVFGVLDQGVEGAYAEKLTVKAAIIAKKSDSLGHAEAAAMALTSLTALWALEDEAKLAGGETILIQGGAGGVAGFAIQFAKHLGATVITTASPDNHDYVRSLGADRVIDYHSEDFTRTVSDCDVVFDTVGGEVQVRSYEVLKPGGRLVWIAPARGGLPTDPHRRPHPAPQRPPRPPPPGTYAQPARRRRRLAARRHPATPSPKPPPPTASAKPATCAASWCSRCGDMQY